MFMWNIFSSHAVNINFTVDLKYRHLQSGLVQSLPRIYGAPVSLNVIT
jgi:hypothetical protein